MKTGWSVLWVRLEPGTSLIQTEVVTAVPGSVTYVTLLLTRSSGGGQRSEKRSIRSSCEIFIGYVTTLLQL
jgi:hypothetical protein